ncbi:MAG: uridine monophosphate kinase [Hamadaea sp.]|nr:uridine monophosphate kinase [Hamadaea sp.]
MPKRFVLKVSGEALSGKKGFGSDPEVITHLASCLAEARGAGYQLAVVVGGGNYFRGGDESGWTIPRTERDNVGILGTVMNGIFLRGALLNCGVDDARLMTAIPIPSIAEPYIRLRADHHLNKGKVLILAGGNGQPFVTTDYPSVQRAIELDAEALLVAKNGVSGIMTADPKVDASARLLDKLSHEDVIDRRIRVMDQAAFVLAMENSLTLKVFDVAVLNQLTEICGGEHIGTLVESPDR